MANPTTEHVNPAAGQMRTPGVGTQGAQAKAPAAEAAKPTLLEDIDPILLVRLYPAAKDAAEMRAQALAAGQATHEAGAKLLASQNEPVLPPAA